MLRSAMRWSLAENSTPITSRKGRCEASSSTRPLPEPKSTKLNRDRSVGIAVIICLKAPGVVGRYRIAWGAEGEGTARTRCDSIPAVSTPCSRSNLAACRLARNAARPKWRRGDARLIMFLRLCAPNMLAHSCSVWSCFKIAPSGQRSPSYRHVLAPTRTSGSRFGSPWRRSRWRQRESPAGERGALTVNVAREHSSARPRAASRQALNGLERGAVLGACHAVLSYPTGNPPDRAQKSLCGFGCLLT